MTTIELRTSILADLDQMNVEMLESVSRYVKRLRRHAMPVRHSKLATAHQITPGVSRLIRENPWDISDEELDQMRYEYLMEKYK